MSRRDARTGRKIVAAFDGDPLECREHAESPAMSCRRCMAADPSRRSEVGAAVVAAARSLVGVPYAHRGRTRAGLDCTGLAKLARSIAGVSGDGDKEYREDLLDVDAVAEIEARVATSRDLSRISEGEAVLFGMKSRWWHFGIVTADETIVAALRRSGGVIEHAFDYRWARRAFLRVLLPGGR
jgi:cell wall-associated NlpC family hydrolase